MKDKQPNGYGSKISILVNIVFFTNIAVTRATKRTHLSLIDQDMTYVITSRVRKAFMEQ